MSKVLFTSHTGNFVKFNAPFIKWFSEQGWEVHYASAEEEPFPEGLCDQHFMVPFQRTPFHPDNIKAYRVLRDIICREQYDLIHCHTPVGGAITRLAARKCRQRQGTKVIYTAHGFHFYKGAPFLNWILYYPIEKWLASLTDCIVTINYEDYELARMKFHCKKVAHIDGVGVDLDAFHPIDHNSKQELREEYGFPENALILIYAAELNANKNQGILIRAVHSLMDSFPDIYLLLLGDGQAPIEERYRKLIHEEELEGRVLLMGYRKDVIKLFQLSDICVASSIREGLGLNVIEAMACGLPVVASSNRGHRELIVPEKNGFLFSLNNIEELCNGISRLASDSIMYEKISRHNASYVEKYSLRNSIQNMGDIYHSICTEVGR